jgi:hypothetical protein
MGNDSPNRFDSYFGAIKSEKGIDLSSVGICSRRSGSCLYISNIAVGSTEEAVTPRIGLSGVLLEGIEKVSDI